MLALCRRLIVPWHLLLLLLLGSTCGQSIGKSLIGAPDVGQCLLPALLRLLGCHPLQQLLLVQHLRRQLALRVHIPFRQHTLSQPKPLYIQARVCHTACTCSPFCSATSNTCKVAARHGLSQATLGGKTLIRTWVVIEQCRLGLGHLDHGLLQPLALLLLALILLRFLLPR